MQLQGKRVAVVGAANGIGAALVQAFVAEGARVAAFDIRDEDGQTVTEAATATGPGTAHFFHCDATARAEVSAAFAAGATALGGYDALVVTAGVHKELAPEAIEDAEFDRMMNINVRSVFVTNQEIFPYLRDNGGGRIINFGSGSGLRPTPTAAHYSASKGAVISWTRSLAYAWGQHNITANVVNPAIGGTLMFSESAAKAAREGQQATADALAQARLFPLGARRFPATDEDLAAGFGNADTDLAPVLVFLVGDGARFLTAQIFPVDGGLTPNR